MKKWMKGIAITGGVLLVLGAGITGLALTVGGLYGEGTRELRSFFGEHFDRDDFGYLVDMMWIQHNEKEETGSYDGWKVAPKEEMRQRASLHDITHLEVKAERAAVRIVENPDLKDEIAVYLKEASHADVDIETSEHSGKAEIDFSYSKRGNGYVQGIIEVPEGYRLKELELEGKAGYLEVVGLWADHAEVEAKASEINMDSFTAGVMNLSSDASSVKIFGNVENSADVEAKAGVVKMRLEGRKSDFSYILDNAVGSVRIGDDTYAGISNETVTNQHAEKVLRIDCSAGSVDITFDQTD